MAGVNFVLHAAGGIQAGLTTSYEKLLIDADQCAQLQRFSEGIDLSKESFAYDAIREVGPGSHFLGAAHTLRHYKTAMYRSPLADTNSREQWQAEGARDIAARAHIAWKEMVRQYVAPPLDSAIDEEPTAFVARRKAEMPDELG